jgi:hypothetical protein
MVGHQLKQIQLNLVDLQGFMQDSLKRSVLRFFMKNGRSQIAAIQGVVQPACFVCT